MPGKKAGYKMTEDYKRKLLAKAAAKSLTLAERLDIEQAMQTDTFFKEAYQGYLLSDTSQNEELKNLHQQLSDRVEKTANRRFFTPLWAAAAVLILLLAVSLWTFSGRSSSKPIAGVFQESDFSAEKQEEGEIVAVQEQTVESDESQELEAFSPEESSVAIEPTKDAVSKVRTTEDAKQSQRSANESEVAAEDAGIANNQTTAKIVPLPEVDVTSADNSIPEETHLVASGRVLNQALQPLPAVKLQYLSSDPIGYSDSAGGFAYTIDPAEKYLQFEAEGYQPLIMSLDNLQKRDLVMQAPTLSIATNEGGAQLRSRPKSQSQSKLLDKSEQLTNFQDYLKKNRQYPAEAAEDGKSGDVEIRFTLDQSGRPDLFYLKSSPHPSCTAEAVRLLREGPSWFKVDNQEIYQVIVPCMPSQ